MHKINTINARNKLAIRNEPYWISIATGRAIGYRKTVDGGNWQGKYINSQGKRFKQSLGNVNTLTYEEALGECNSWFKEMESSSTGGKPDKHTVANAVEKYLIYLKLEGTKSTYDNVVISVNAHILPKLGSIELNKLTTLVLVDWKNSLVVTDQGTEKQRRSQSTCNRIITTLKALLNRAYLLNMAQSDLAWKKLKKFKNVSQSRNIFLSKQELDALVKICKTSLKDLVRAGIYTGCRLSELTNAKIADFNPSKNYIAVDGKTGPRKVYLTSDGVVFFTGLCEGRPSTDWLMLNNTGSQWARNQHTHLFNVAAKQAGLPSESCFYSLRHAYISQCLLNNVNIHLLARQCGNSAVIIEKNYANFISEDIEDAISKGAPY